MASLDSPVCSVGTAKEDDTEKESWDTEKLTIPDGEGSRKAHSSGQ
jgi:hypothetical protein